MVEKVKLISEWFIQHNDDVASDSLDGHFKLQKLLYYSYAMYLAVYNEELFSNKIEAWENGPVVRQAFYFYKIEHLALKTPTLDKNDIADDLSDDITNVLRVVNFEYGTIPAKGLIDQTHSEKPWQDLREQALCGQDPEISKDSIRDFYGKSLLEIYRTYIRNISYYESLSRLELSNSVFLYDKKVTQLTNEDMINLFELSSHLENDRLFVYKDDGELVTY